MATRISTWITRSAPLASSALNAAIPWNLRQVMMPGLSSRFRLPTSWRSCRIRATICQHNMQRILFSLLLVSLVAIPACTKTEKPDARPDARVVVTAGSYDQLLKESNETHRPGLLGFVVWAVQGDGPDLRRGCRGEAGRGFWQGERR